MANFTDEQIAQLSGNQNVQWVSRTGVQFTPEFKILAWEQKQQGRRMKDIFRDNGIDPDILEKLVQTGFIQRKGKQLLPTQDGINLAAVLPEALTSPALTAEGESRLTEIAKGEADPDEFMAGIEAQARDLVKTYSCVSEDKQKLFQTERVVIGTCPRCGEAVYEGKKNYYCGNRACQFVMWKNDRFFEERKKAFTPKIAAALLKDGKVKIKGLFSPKTGKTYDGTVLLADTGGRYVNFRMEWKKQ